MTARALAHAQAPSDWRTLAWNAEWWNLASAASAAISMIPRTMHRPGAKWTDVSDGSQ